MLAPELAWGDSLTGQNQGSHPERWAADMVPDALEHPSCLWAVGGHILACQEGRCWSFCRQVEPGLSAWPLPTLVPLSVHPSQW